MSGNTMHHVTDRSEMLIVVFHINMNILMSVCLISSVLRLCVTEMNLHSRLTPGINVLWTKIKR